MGTVARVQRSTTFFLDRSQPHKWMPSEVSGRVPPPPVKLQNALGGKLILIGFLNVESNPPPILRKQWNFEGMLHP